jgi:hypothetical protein
MMLPPPPVVPGKQVPAFLSRSQWTKRYKPPDKKPPVKDPSEDKPYPQSVRMLGYAVAMTVIPYGLAWLVASNETLRDSLSLKDHPKLADALRTWFGHEEVDALSYVERRQKVPVPRQLEREDPAKVRQEQAALAALQETYLVPTRIRVFTHNNGFNLGEIIQLPGTTRATEEELLLIIMKDRHPSIERDSVSHVTVEFSNVQEEDDTQNSTCTMTNDIGSVQEESAILQVHSMVEPQQQQQQQQQSTLSRELAKLIKSITIYSAWHVFPEYSQAQMQQINEQQQQQKQGAQSDNFRISELQYEIEQLEKQLKDHTTMRSFDDIQHELNQATSELRRLKWKRRLRIFG